MKIASPKLFYFSLTSFIITFLISQEFHQAVGAAVTRDFNFAEPITYGLIVIQGLVSLAGMAASLKRSPADKS